MVSHLIPRQIVWLGPLEEYVETWRRQGSQSWSASGLWSPSGIWYARLWNAATAIVCYGHGINAISSLGGPAATNDGPTVNDATADDAAAIDDCPAIAADGSNG